MQKSTQQSIFSDSRQKHGLLGFEVHGKFEAGPDEEEDLKEVVGDVDDEASSGQELAEDEAADGNAMVAREIFSNHEDFNMKEKLSCEPLLSHNSTPLNFPYSK